MDRLGERRARLLGPLRESEETFAAAEDRDRPQRLAYFDGAYLAAVRLASHVQSVRTVTYLVDLSHRLAPFRAEPAVRMLDEQIGLLVH